MRRLVPALAFMAAAAISQAADLKLNYVKSVAGPLYSYTFTLGVDTSTSAWAPGMGWSWLIFGDAVSTASPMSDFTMTSSFPVGPWTALGSTGGFHNGPTFHPIASFWVPVTAGDTLTWTGTSAWNAPDGELLFSALLAQGGATNVEFKVANAQPVPEPATMAALGLGALALLKRRKK